MIFFRTGLSKCGRLDVTWLFTVIFSHLFRFVWDIQKKEKEYILVAEKRSSTRRNASHGSMGRLDDEPMRQCATMVVAGVDGEGANGRAKNSKKSVDGRCAWPVRNWCAGRGEAFAERMQQLRRRAGAAVLSWQSALSIMERIHSAQCTQWSQEQSTIHCCSYRMVLQRLSQGQLDLQDIACRC